MPHPPHPPQWRTRTPALTAPPASFTIAATGSAAPRCGEPPAAAETQARAGLGGTRGSEAAARRNGVPRNASVARALTTWQKKRAAGQRRGERAREQSQGPHPTPARSPGRARGLPRQRSPHLPERLKLRRLRRRRQPPKPRRQPPRWRQPCRRPPQNSPQRQQVSSPLPSPQAPFPSTKSTRARSSSGCWPRTSSSLSSPPSRSSSVSAGSASTG